jgi:hypothetical protein
MNSSLARWIWSVLAMSALILSACRSTYTNRELVFGYNLDEPSSTVYLPDTLREISGLTSLDSSSFACIQDENGVLFIYDLSARAIRSEYAFTMDGDYEGIARVGNTIYVLRSDGTLFEIVDFASPDFKLDSLHTGIPARNNEGLCYDRTRNRLLIACKGKIAKGPAFKDQRVIYGFDLVTRTLSVDPVFDFDLNVIREFARSHKLDIPTRKRKRKGQSIEETLIKFKTSAIAVHPVTDKLYLLSAADHLLFLFDMNGALEHIELLNPEMFNKPEGITFFENGRMCITNEGQGQKATVLQFNFVAK